LSYNTFKCGYPIEHGVHAVAVFESVFDTHFDEMESVVEISKKTEMFAFEEGPIANKFDFEFKLTQSPSLLNTFLAPEVSVAIRGGKRHSVDQKTLELQFQNATLMCGINDGTVALDGVPFMTVDGEDPYLSILNSIYSNDKNCSGFTSMTAAMRAVRWMESAPHH